MRIACVSETWPPEVNGVALTVARTVDFLRHRGHVLEVIRPRQGRGDAGGRWQMLVPGWPVPGYPGLRCGAPVRRRLLRHWRHQAPQLVHVATEGPLGWAALAAARQLGIPVTTDYRTRFDVYSRLYAPVCGRWPGRVIQSWLRHFHNQALCTFVPTLDLLGQLERAGYRNLVLNGRGVDTTLFRPQQRSPALRACWGATNPTVPVVLHVGRLAREKNVALLGLAWQGIRTAQPTARFVVVGDGPLRPMLERAWPDVVFAGVQRGGLLAAHYASADLFLFPSLSETFGNVILEAMASGLPTVAFGDAAAGQVIRDRCSGYLAVPGDEAGFVQAATVLATDMALRGRIGRAAVDAARAHTWERVLADFEDTLLDAQALGAFDDTPCVA